MSIGETIAGKTIEIHAEDLDIWASFFRAAITGAVPVSMAHPVNVTVEYASLVADDAFREFAKRREASYD